MESSSNTTYLEVITAQSSLLNAEISEVTDQLSKMQAVVSLYQALGGGAKWYLQFDNLQFTIDWSI